jgi:hypothetical protein
MSARKWLVPFVAAALLGNPVRANEPEDSQLMQAMEQELQRSFSALKDAGPAPVHYLAYRVYDQQSMSISGCYGGVEC